MAGLTPFGTLWGQLPTTLGEIHYVSPGASYSIGGRLSLIHI